MILAAVSADEIAVFDLRSDTGIKALRSFYDGTALDEIKSGAHITPHPAAITPETGKRPQGEAVLERRIDELEERLEELEDEMD